jgi:hypothetical protein
MTKATEKHAACPKPPPQKNSPRTRARCPVCKSSCPNCAPASRWSCCKELHILTREGKLNQDTRRKLKQVYHLVQFIEPLLAEVMQARGDVTLADHGAGKSYLGFILYDLFFKDKGWAMCTAWRRAPNWWRSRRRWRALGFERMGFLATTVQQALNHPELPAASTWSPRCTPATPPPTTPLPLAWPAGAATWCWCRVARPRWPV